MVSRYLQSPLAHCSYRSRHNDSNATNLFRDEQWSSWRLITLDLKMKLGSLKFDMVFATGMRNTDVIVF